MVRNNFLDGFNTTKEFNAVCPIPIFRNRPIPKVSRYYIITLWGVYPDILYKKLLLVCSTSITRNKDTVN
jgi:hypothetical protein